MKPLVIVAIAIYIASVIGLACLFGNALASDLQDDRDRVNGKRKFDTYPTVMWGEIWSGVIIVLLPFINTYLLIRAGYDQMIEHFKTTVIKPNPPVKEEDPYRRLI